MCEHRRAIIVSICAHGGLLSLSARGNPSASNDAYPALQQLVLLPGAIVQRFVAAARDIVVADGAVELTHREVDALSIDPVVEMPDAVDIGLQDLAAKLVMNDERRHA